MVVSHDGFPMSSTTIPTAFYTGGFSTGLSAQVLRWQIICNAWWSLVALMLDFVPLPASDRPPWVALRTDHPWWR